GRVEGRQGEVRRDEEQEREGSLRGRRQGQGEGRQGRARPEEQTLGAQRAQGRGSQGRAHVPRREGEVRPAERQGREDVREAGEGRLRQGQGGHQEAVRR